MRTVLRVLLAAWPPLLAGCGQPSGMLDCSGHGTARGVMLVAVADATPQAAAFGSLQISALEPQKLNGAGDEYWLGGLPYRSLYNRPRERDPGPGAVFSACAAAALYRGKVFRDMGGFDEDFFCYCEDVDLGFRLRLRGYDILQAPGAIVRHVGGGAAGARSSFAVFHGTRNRLWTFMHNMPGAWFYALAPLHAAMTLFVLAWSLFPGINTVGEVKNFDFSIYPNPSNGTFIIAGGSNVHDDYTVTVFDVMGHAVKQFSWKGQKTTIDLSGYAKGVYVVRVWDEKEALLRKVILQ